MVILPKEANTIANVVRNWHQIIYDMQEMCTFWKECMEEKGFSNSLLNSCKFVL